MSGLKQFREDNFRAAQRPASWLLTAERLRDGAEAILTHEQAFEVPYFQAHSAAVQEAMAIAYSEGNDSRVADIGARAPNYPAAQLLYGYALENLLKGIWIAKDPSLISTRKLNRKLASHDLVKLAKQAGFVLHIQEEPVAEALSQLSVWAGRYPVALLEAEFASTPNADELLDYGSRHPIVKAMYARGHAELTALLPNRSQIGTARLWFSANLGRNTPRQVAWVIDFPNEIFPCLPIPKLLRPIAPFRSNISILRLLCARPCLPSNLN